MCVCVCSQEDPSLLSHLLEALDSGAPPHGGIALGKVNSAPAACYDPYIVGLQPLRGSKEVDRHNIKDGKICVWGRLVHAQETAAPFETKSQH